jgi:hypothetical protein
MRARRGETTPVSRLRGCCVICGAGSAMSDLRAPRKRQVLRPRLTRTRTSTATMNMSKSAVPGMALTTVDTVRHPGRLTWEDYPRARPALSPEWELAGDQIYTLAYVFLITYPCWIELQGIGGSTFPTLDKGEIWICHSVHCVALLLQFASRLFMWLRCLGLELRSLVRRRGAENCRYQYDVTRL